MNDRKDLDCDLDGITELDMDSECSIEFLHIAKELKRRVEVAEDIQHAEKEILLKEIEAHMATKAELAALKAIPDYRLSFGGNLSLELEKQGYKKAGMVVMDNGKEGVVYHRKVRT